MTPEYTVQNGSPGTLDTSGPANARSGRQNDAVLLELQALRRSEAVLRDFIETSTISLHWVGADGTILWANQAELDLLGYMQEEYIGRNISEFHSDAPVIKEILACLSRGDTLRDYPARLRHRDGSIRHVLINSSVLFENGKFVHTRCFTRDITALKQEQEMREEQSRVDAFATRIGQHLITSSTLSDMLRNCTEAMTSQLGAAFARIWTLNEQENVLELQASSGLYTHLNGHHARIPVDSYKIGRIAAQRAPHLTNQVIGDASVPEQEWARKEGMVAFAGYPLIVEDRIVGVIGMFSRHALSDITLQAMARVADQIAIGIERKRVEKALRASEAQLAAELADMQLLHGLSTQLINEQSVETLYAKIMDVAVAIMRSDMASMQVVDETEDALRMVVFRGFEPEFGSTFGLNRRDTRTSCSLARQTGRRVIVPDVEACDFLAGTPALQDHIKTGIRAVQSTPLISRSSGRLLGMISTHWRTPHQPAERQLRLLDIVARHAADLIERKKADEALRESQTRLSAELADTKLLQDISAQLIEQGDEDALYGKIVDAIASIMRSDFATMQMLCPEGGPKGELRLLSSRGLTPEGAKVWARVCVDTESTCGQALRTSKRAIAANVETSEFLAGTAGMAALLDAGIHAAQSTPLFSRSGRMLGMISSHWRKPHAPTERDLRLLDILARQAADLIERRQADEALRGSERRLHEIVEAIPAAVYTTDAEGRITFFNRAAVEFSGRVPELGTDSWCVSWKLYNMDGTRLPHDQCPMAVALREKRPVLGCEAVAERPDGMRRVFTPYPTPLFDANGRLTGAVNMLVDITDRKRAEETLRESEERFRAIVDTTPECVKVIAADGTLMLMNEAGLALVGAAAADDLTGRSVYDLIAPQDREVFRGFNERVCGGEKASLEFDIIGLKGRRRRMETHAVPLRWPDGSIVQLGITRDISARAKAEETRLLLGAIVDSSDDAIISKDLGGQITSWNQGAERLYGYTAAEAVGKSIMIVVPHDRQEEEREILARLQRGDRVDHFETIRQRKDGALLNISLTISPLKNQQGEIIGASKIARDITDQKRAEGAIRRLNAQLTEDLAAMTRMQQLSTRLIQAGGFPELLREILDAGIDITAADMGNIQLLDDAGGLRIVAHRGFESPFLEFFNEVHDGLAACGSALQKGERVIVEDVARDPVFAGTPALDAMLAAEARAVQSTPLVSRAGKVLGMFSTHYRSPRRPNERELRLLDLLARQAADLIERKRGEEGRSQLSAIVESSGDAIYIYDFDGKIQTWNRAAEELYGYSRNEIIGGNAITVIPPDRQAELPDVISPAIRAGETMRNWETRRMRRGGHVFPAILTISPIHDESGKPSAISVITRDITDSKRAEDELRRANQDLQQFAYSASHDLQEPLRTIKIYSELLADRLSAAIDGETAVFLDFLRSAATRMEMLVRDLLAYTQVTKFDAPLEDVDTNEVLAEVTSNLGGAITESGAAVTCGKLPAVRAHSTHMRQLFQNLIGNAIKYRSENRAPEVHIGAERQDGYWVFTVRDNGIGIQPEFKEQIFGLFSRLHNADRYAGTGIGLAICQRIVERYHGRIWVESEPGRGSDFKFALPV